MGRYKLPTLALRKIRSIGPNSRSGTFYPVQALGGMDRIEERSIGRVQDCLNAAAHCEKRAASATDRTTQATFAEAARCWRKRARCWRELPKRSWKPPEHPPTTL